MTSTNDTTNDTNADSIPISISVSLSPKVLISPLLSKPIISIISPTPTTPSGNVLTGYPTEPNNTQEATATATATATEPNNTDPNNTDPNTATEPNNTDTEQNTTYDTGMEYWCTLYNGSVLFSTKEGREVLKVQGDEDVSNTTIESCVTCAAHNCSFLLPLNVIFHVSSEAII